MPENQTKRNYYEVLRLPKNCTSEEIKKNYKKIAKEVHPDINNSPDAIEKFKELNEAYEILNDEKKRNLYDLYGEEGVRSEYTPFTECTGEQPFEVFLKNIFKQNQFNDKNGKKRGKDSIHPLNISLEELYTGVTKKIKVTRTRLCKKCEGTGATEKNKIKNCEKCDGKGKIIKVIQFQQGFYNKLLQNVQIVMELEKLLIKNIYVKIVKEIKLHLIKNY